MTKPHPSPSRRSQPLKLPAKPNFSIERHYNGAIAGIDEAGRGPWAGPVTAAAVILDSNPRRLPRGLNDSKRLKPEQREALFEALLSCAQIGIGHASVEEIDSLNILAATMLAMQRAVAALPIMPDVALVDGNRVPALPCQTQWVVSGDARSLSIASASIIAKVTRDRIMRELANEWPDYGFERHAGYGTPYHQEALARHGVTPHHRRSFAPIRALLQRPQEQAA